MISAWKRRDNYWTNIDSPDFVQGQMYTGYVETRRHGLSGLNVNKKNNLWMLWESTPKPLRQEGSVDTRFVMWGCTDIPGSGSPAGIMQEVRESESGGGGLAYSEGIGQRIHAEADSLDLCKTGGRVAGQGVRRTNKYIRRDRYQRPG